MKLQLAIVIVGAFLLEASVAKFITETIKVENGIVTKSSFEDGPYGGKGLIFNFSSHKSYRCCISWGTWLMVIFFTWKVEWEQRMTNEKD